MGAGPVGRVFFARDRIAGRAIAVKVLAPSLAEDPRARRAFARQIHLGAIPSHPNLAPVHDLGLTAVGVPYVATARADGDLVGVAAPAWSVLVRWLDSALAALGHLHARGRIHGGLAPTNLLRTSAPEGLWVSDPGHAAVGDRRVTPYHPPEVAGFRTAEVGPWSDLYALGVIAWELTTGRVPFAAGSGPADAALPPFTPRTAVPVRLETVLANLLRSEPLSRYDLAADVRTELRALDEDRAPISSRRPIREGTAAQGIALRATPAGAPLDDVSVSTTARAEPHGFESPRWNRPFPPPMPDGAPLEPTAGPGSVSLALAVAREVPLVGRAARRQVLWDAAREVITGGRTRVVLVVGPAGSGRTRFVTWLTRGIEEGGHAESVWLTYSIPAGATDGATGAAFLQT
ncbi:MAG: hypothetical protein ABMB14_31275, partial [Myxococcota bacterium]